ncbi:hypothetical protein F4813DRAFT_284969 [Daldinia decipiens]|uniref:uncharacterized protein n=1 Tax=Daldinia decipiens TaxID=326647 RepID=UPI0020C46E64|nr:uncharacterized protein F4813DRAFT_284969 [Daldinia decipiens]KAI1653067.1 hypothetical protein F4813DRAFT_284969 [Daldinia decipiens]
MEQQNNDSFLLKLPVELVNGILELIPPIDRAVASLTCRSLRLILGKSDAHNLSTAQYLRYHVRVARDLPDRWVCEACFKLHPVSLGDTPLTPWRMTCPLRWDRWCHEVYGQQSRLDNRYLSVDHRHVQLALKYTRLQDHWSRRHLHTLLANHRDDEFPTHPYPYNRQNVLKVTYTVTPRVVRDQHENLRYMLRSVWHFRKDSMEISLVTVGDIKLCPHLALLGDMRRMEVHQLDILQEIKRAILLNGIETYIAGCNLCATDFKIAVHKDHITVHTWQDMGTKGSPGDKAWRLHVSDSRFGMPPLGGRWPMFANPGSVRALYNGAKRSPKPKAAPGVDNDLRPTGRSTNP